MSKASALAQVKCALDAFNNFTSDRRQVPTRCGQMVGCESYQIRFTGYQEAAVRESIESIMNHIEEIEEIEK